VNYGCMLLIAAASLCIPTAVAQTPTRGFPQPPQSMDPQNQPQPAAKYPATPARRPDLAQAQREADTLARMAQTIPADMTKIREGMLPKDVIEKLKQIEKMSKHLRGELTR
jgi:hypothetical protein